MYGFKTLDLTEEEEKILKLRKSGYSIREIAEKLGVTKNRVAYLRSRATEKLQAQERLKIEGIRKIRF